MGSIDAGTLAAIREVVRDELGDLLRLIAPGQNSVELKRPTDPTKQGEVTVKVYAVNPMDALEQAKEAFKQAIKDADELAPPRPK